MKIDILEAHVRRAVRKGDLSSAERWTKLAERQLQLKQRQMTLDEQKFADRLNKLQEEMFARAERELRRRGF